MMSSSASGTCVPTAPTTAVVHATPRLSKGPEVTRVNCRGNFPAVGSLLGDYFCLGKLGKGTFCSIHKCCSLKYWKNPSKGRLVAAKVELQNFANSGVLMGEAFMLQHLDQSVPTGTVPVYHGHMVSDKIAAIVMEFLQGNDMHQLREGLGGRRISVDDAVFLTADIFVPLLQRMHEAGVVHRDVKPSNCVRKEGKDFIIVDFGLSKSIVVEKDSPHAGDPFNETQHFRQEREKADFRGTSMYASLRVHELKDYAFRDDMWSVLYVFCDLVSGGLPWMSYAAARDRDTCEKIKRQVFEQKTANVLLMGEQYHLMKYKREKMKEEGKTDLPDLPEPLPLSRDMEKVRLLQTAFDHVGGLSFTERPNYEFLRKCLKGFNIGNTYDSAIKKMDWTIKPKTLQPHTPRDGSWDSNVPRWDLADVEDPVDDKQLWKEAEAQVDPEMNKGLVGDDADFCRLPVDLHFRIAQMDYNTTHSKEIPPHIALRDFMKCALPLVYGKWDANKFEKDNHSQAGYRREVFLKIVEKCLTCALTFHYFYSKDCYYEPGEEPNRKRRKIVSDMGDLVAVSKAIFGLQQMKREEIKKRRAPPPVLSFGS